MYARGRSVKNTSQRRLEGYVIPFGESQGEEGEYYSHATRTNYHEISTVVIEKNQSAILEIKIQNCGKEVLDKS